MAKRNASGPDARLFGHRTVTEAAVHGFAVRTGDDARMHLDHELARAGPTGRPIAQGLLTACWALGALSRHAGDRLLLQDPRAWIAGASVQLSRVVSIGDTLAFRDSPSQVHAFDGLPGDPSGDSFSATAASATPAGPPEEAETFTSTAFEAVNQRGEVAASGIVTVARSPEGAPRDSVCGSAQRAPACWPKEVWSPPDPPVVFHAEDLLAAGPRGESPGWTLFESDVVGFAREMGELDPRYLNAEFAAGTVFGGCIAPPMLVYCLAFADFLKSLLRVPMPDAGAAGHLADAWRCYRPARIGDTLRTRHRPLSCRRSKSRPDRAIVRFGLQVLGPSDALIQEGRVALMIPARPRPDPAEATLREPAGGGDASRGFATVRGMNTDDLRSGLEDPGDERSG